MLAPSNRADGVRYFELYPGVMGFECTSLHCTLTTASCAANWSKREQRPACANCHLGAIHAGKAQAEPAAPTLVCVRCGCGDIRLIGGSLCRSCFNRTREVCNGRNSKGKRPTITGAKLMECSAIVRISNPPEVLREMFQRRKSSTNGWTAWMRSTRLPGLPTFEAIDSEHIWIESVSSGPDELNRLLRKLLPTGKIVASEFGPAFTEKWAIEDDQTNGNLSKDTEGNRS